MLRLRVLSALVGIPIMLGAIYLGGPWYTFFLLLVVNLGMREFDAMLKSKGSYLPAIIGYVGASALIILLFLQEFSLVFPLIMIIFTLLLLMQLALFDKVNFWESAMLFWGIIYLGGLCGYMLLLRLLPQGIVYTYLLFIAVWIHDTLAYFIGIKWGRRKLAPTISPNKSVEGSLGGAAGTVILAVAVSLQAPHLTGLTWFEAALLGLGISVFAQLGDLLESALKRKFQVKDSGALIPGHGGILDRFDSLMLAAPFVYYFFRFIELF